MPKIPRLSMKDRVVTGTQERVIAGEIAPGTRITEQALVDEYGVSHSVVREAMVVLELRGIIVSKSYKSSEVASISRSEVEHLLLPVRVTVEKYALETGFERFNARYDDFENALSDMARAIDDQDIRAFNTADIAFHELIVDLGGSATVRGVWTSIQQRIRMHFAVQTKRSGARLEFLDHHRALLEVFRTGDLDASLDALERHILETNTPHLDLLEATGS